MFKAVVASTPVRFAAAIIFGSHFCDNRSVESGSPILFSIEIKPRRPTEKQSFLVDKRIGGRRTGFATERRNLPAISRDLAKVEAGKMDLYPEIFSLPRTIGEVCAVSKPIIKGLSDWRLSGLRRPSLRASRILLSRVCRKDDCCAVMRARTSPYGPPRGARR
jgi:hypothetical protein